MADHDVIIIGAGFAGLYQLYKLRELGFDARVLEAGPEVGGTWYWNRYPGARCDIESIEYSYSFDPELQQSWNWSERYAAQPELLAYAKHVADRYHLRPHISFDTRVVAMEFDDTATEWTVTTESGSLTATFVVAATGCLSKPLVPSFEGLDDFTGDVLWTWDWPADGADLAGKRVAVVGTGSSGVQTITAIAPVVGTLTVFQRTPPYAVPAQNRPIADELEEVKRRYPQFREVSRVTRGGAQCGEGADLPPFFGDLASDATRSELTRRWDDGGLCFQQAFYDLLLDPVANETAAEYVRDRIRQKVSDPELAEKLTPRGYPIAAKRLCVDTGYYEVYNQDNVTLVDLNEQPLRRITARGILAGDTEHEVDVIVLATGFDAMTGALNAIDIRAVDHNGVTRTLRDKWADGPRTYLGLMSAGFPNLFTVTGPQSPSVLSNMLTSIEYHVEWISAALAHLREQGLDRMEAEPTAEDNWVNITNDTADLTLLPQAASWYMGANVPGKRRVFLPFVAGVGVYKQIGDGVAVAGYHGFEMA
ncbi:cyclohexanone monooxygenase [Mycolicibacterium conceptionense]|uniref:Cyclohexanone monooxygenase n=1 Tax=Mycolicibacterium conceptionense TaxID=451644 RepID=A0A1A1Z7I0_9MYCO|nr:MULTISPECIES: NAD(P)/FAD-dependent oxidoreductase [Mycolicibacterium]MCW1820415.1 NAD(P)/FAD-dependent oxidoreductase [Mycolicibacterium senegalense]OBB04743.1 cyclohexanone monooxygenase [Mycolicibacterium conceptionense]OBF03142.1 cyclohexanone monooxygenase [Mycolicibacterium conceptionense]OBF12320.1 cyclohexanone monooxygenase [Mycolicibacterium conceptionense]OBF39499.1 cyclohexanone monooxygenase [Mycolicibacterium conceptionense]